MAAAAGSKPRGCRQERRRCARGRECGCCRRSHSRSPPLRRRRRAKAMSSPPQTPAPSPRVSSRSVPRATATSATDSAQAPSRLRAPESRVLQIESQMRSEA
eukprot:2333540-Pleurochrysis_carterae.AAC.1